MSKNRTRSADFTLVELLVVIAIICILILLIGVTYNSVYKQWATTNTMATMRRAALTMDNFYRENGYLPLPTKSNLNDGGWFALGTDAAVDLKSNPSTNDFSSVYGIGVTNQWGRALRDLKPFVREKEYTSAQKDKGLMLGWVYVYDDYGKRSPIYYVYGIKNSLNLFVLASKGLDGNWGGGDDIVYLPNGKGLGKDRKFKPGFYRGSLAKNQLEFVDETKDEIEFLEQ